MGYKYKTFQGWRRAYTKEFYNQFMKYPSECGVGTDHMKKEYEAGRNPQSTAIMDIRKYRGA